MQAAVGHVQHAGRQRADDLPAGRDGCCGCCQAASSPSHQPGSRVLAVSLHLAPCPADSGQGPANSSGCHGPGGERAKDCHKQQRLTGPLGLCMIMTLHGRSCDGQDPDQGHQTGGMSASCKLGSKRPRPKGCWASSLLHYEACQNTCIFLETSKIRVILVKPDNPVQGTG